MNDENLLKEFADLLKNFQGLYIKQEENENDLESYSKIVTNLTEIIDSDVNSPQHPFQFIETFNKFSQNKQIMLNSKCKINLRYQFDKNLLRESPKNQNSLSPVRTSKK